MTDSASERKDKGRRGHTSFFYCYYVIFTLRIYPPSKQVIKYIRFFFLRGGGEGRSAEPQSPPHQKKGGEAPSKADFMSHSTLNPKAVGYSLRTRDIISLLLAPCSAALSLLLIITVSGLGFAVAGFAIAWFAVAWAWVASGSRSGSTARR